LNFAFLPLESRFSAHYTKDGVEAHGAYVFDCRNVGIGQLGIG